MDLPDLDGWEAIPVKTTTVVSQLFSDVMPGLFMPLTREDVKRLPPEHRRHVTTIDRSNQMPIDPSEQPLTRRSLRAYHPKVTEFLLSVVNTDGAQYRQTNNTIVLYPPDGSANVTVYARNSDRQLRSLTQWHDKHFATQEVTVPPVDVSDAPTPAEIVVHPLNVVPDEVPEPLPVHDPDPDDEHWQTYLATNGEPNELIETDGAWYRCRECRLNGEEWVTYSAAGIGGHIRMKHRDRSSLRTPEAMAKSLDTRRYNALARHAENAVAELQKALGKSTAADRIAELEVENEGLRSQLAECKARLDLIAEAYRA